MKICSFNVRGLGGVVKKNKIRSLVSKEKLDFIALQETKLEDVSGVLCKNLWVGDLFDFCFLPSLGNSGGILSIWNSTKAKKLFWSHGRGFVGMCLEWGGER